jgi:CelD/BcsL family acetyltransferase involved in cellulose biosynthesis
MNAAAFTFEQQPSPRPTVPGPALVPQRADSSPAVAPVEYDIVTSRAGFDDLDADWSALFDRAGRGDQMFLSFNWLWHWANHYHTASDRLAIVTARRGGRLIMVWPLTVERVAGMIQLAFMGSPVSQYGDLLIDDITDRNAVLQGAWAHLLTRQRFDIVRLAKVRSDASIAPLLASIGFTVTATEEAPFIALSACASFADYETRSSSKHRKNRRRQLRRIEERGPLRMRRLSGTSEARDAVRLAMTLKRAWLNEKALVSKAFKDERIDGFFMDAISSTTRPCGVEISILETNGECGDANISVSCKGRRAVHILAYNLKFDKLGVGNHHLHSAITDAHADGIQTYDFLAPRHAYKMDWADETTLVRDHTLAMSPLGRLYVDLYVARVREGLKRAMARLPSGLRRWIAGTHTTIP